MSGSATRSGSTLRRRLAPEDGVITVIVALMMVVMLGATALVVDLGRTRHYRQQLQDAADLASVGAAGLLPVKGVTEANNAIAMARMIASANAPALPAAGLSVTFKCVVSDPEGNGGADSLELAYACGPAVAGTWTTGWTTKRGRATHTCVPAAGDLCNTVVVGASQNVKYLFAPAIGVPQGSTGGVQAAACKGFCGQAGGPLDIAVVIDRTASMSTTDVANVKNAANQILTIYDPTQQDISLLALPYGPTSDKCQVASPQNYPDSSVGTWRVVPLSHDYQNTDGTINTSSQLAQKISCLVIATNPVVKVNGTTTTSAGHTNLGDPMAAAGTLLSTFGRANVPDVIIFMTDGEANQPAGLQPCSYAVNKANQAMAGGAEIFTIGYGVASARCTQDTSGTYANAYASTLLAAMATASTDNQPGGCAANENTDGDNYFCEARSGDLAPIFRRVAIATIKRSRLIDVD